MPPPPAIRPIRLLISCHSISGYQAAMWRAMSALPELEVHVVAGTSNANFKPAVVEGLNVTLVPELALQDREAMLELARAVAPDVVAIGGWFLKGVAALVHEPEMERARFVLASDRPYLGQLRQHLGRFVHRNLFRRVDKIMVPGERGFQLALRLGFEERRIARGLYGVDMDRLGPLLERRVAAHGGRWPRRWLFMGRYHPDKGVDVLVPAYLEYRRLVADPWPLSTMGSGEMSGLLRGVEGLTDLGFVQPSDQLAVLIDHGAMVLASRFDPWPLVVVEACGAGLPVVCTEACGSSVELVRSAYNGYLCATEDPSSLALAMAKCHARGGELELMGRAGRELAGAYSAVAAARRWADVCLEIVRARGGSPDR